MTAGGPLEGIRVLEFSQLVAGPFSGCVLSDLGAEVIKVERPPGGDPHRNFGAVIPNEGKRFQAVNRGKRSILVDLQTEAGRGLIHRILPAFDVITINFRQRVLERLGIDYVTLSSLHPGLVYCRISAFGSRGPLADRAGTDATMSAYSGLTVGDGKVDEAGGPEHISSGPVSDYTSGLAAVIGICSALYRRGITGRGQLVETSLLRAAMAIQDSYIMREPLSDASTIAPMMEAVEELRAAGASYRELLDARHALRARRWAFRIYYGGFEASDGVMAVGALTPQTRAGARRVLGIGDDASDTPGFDSGDPANIAHATVLLERIRALIRTRPVAEWIEAFEAEGVPVAPVHFPEDLADDPQVNAAGIMTDLEHPLTGPQRVVGPIVELSETPTAVRGPAPLLGADTEAVLREAGCSDADLDAYRAAGAIP